MVMPSPTATNVVGGMDIMQMYLNYMLQFGAMTEDRRQFDAQWGLQMREYEAAQQQRQQQAAMQSAQLQAQGPMFAAQADAIRMSSQMDRLTAEMAKDQWAKEFSLKEKQFGLQAAQLDLQRKVSENQFWLDKESMKQQAAQFAEQMGLDRAKIAASLTGPQDWVKYNSFINYQKGPEGTQLDPEDNPFSGLAPGAGGAPPMGEGPNPSLGGADPNQAGGFQGNGSAGGGSRNPAQGGAIRGTPAGGPLPSSRPGGFVNQGMQGGLSPFQKGEGEAPAWLGGKNFTGAHTGAAYAAEHGGMLPVQQDGQIKVLNPYSAASTVNNHAATPSPTSNAATWTADGNVTFRDPVTGALKKEQKLASGGYVPGSGSQSAPPYTGGGMQTGGGQDYWAPILRARQQMQANPPKPLTVSQPPANPMRSQTPQQPRVQPQGGGNPLSSFQSSQPNNAAQAAAQLGGVQGVGSMGQNQQPLSQPLNAGAPQLNQQQQMIQGLVEQGRALGLKGDALVAYLLGQAGGGGFGGGAGGANGFAGGPYSQMQQPAAPPAAPQGPQVPAGFEHLFPNGMPQGERPTPQEQYNRITSNMGPFSFEVPASREFPAYTVHRNNPQAMQIRQAIPRRAQMPVAAPGSVANPTPQFPPVDELPVIQPPPDPIGYDPTDEYPPLNPGDPNTGGGGWGNGERPRWYPPHLPWPPQQQNPNQQPGPSQNPNEQSNENPYGLPMNGDGSGYPWGQGGNPPAGWAMMAGGSVRDPRGIVWAYNPVAQQWSVATGFAKGGRYDGKQAKPGPAVVGDLPRGQRSGRNPEYVFRPMGADRGMYERRGHNGEEVIQMRPGDAVVPERMMPPWMRSKQRPNPPPSAKVAALGRPTMPPPNRKPTGDRVQPRPAPEPSKGGRVRPRPGMPQPYPWSNPPETGGYPGGGKQSPWSNPPEVPGVPSRRPMPRLASGGYIPTITHDYNPKTGVIRVNNPSVSTGGAHTFTSGDRTYTANEFKEIPLLDKLRGNARGMTKPGAGGQSIAVNNFAIGKTPATMNIRDLQRFLPSELAMASGLYSDLFGMSWEDVIGRSVRQSPAGQRFQAARYG